MSVCLSIVFSLKGRQNRITTITYTAMRTDLMLEYCCSAITANCSATVT